MLHHLDWLIEYWLIFKVDHLSNSPYQGSADKHLLGIYLKSLGPIDRKFRGHGKNDGFALYEYIIKQCSSFCKYTNISIKENNMSTVNRKYTMFMGNT